MKFEIRQYNTRGINLRFHQISMMKRFREIDKLAVLNLQPIS